jgi:HK97 family phage prohead protease
MATKDEFRALPQGYELRDGEGEMPTLVGNLAVFDERAEINSLAEGHFIETIAPGAFDKTISENRDRMRVLFQHGKDPQIGDKPLGPIGSLEADERGVHYEVPLLDTSYNRDLLPGLQAGLYGSSFRFEVLRDNWNRKAGKSDYNPRGLPERTVKEVRMPEFGPVTFPAYWGAKSGLRSLTDRMLGNRMDSEDLGCLAQMIQLGAGYIEEQDEPGDEANVPKMEAIIASLSALIPYEVAEDEGDEPEDEEMASADKRAADDSAPPNDRAGFSHPIRRRRAVAPLPLYGLDRKEVPRWRL